MLLVLLIGVVWFYSEQLLRQAYRLIGSLEALGSPSGLFEDISGGVRTLFYEPRKGLVKSPVAFGQGVLKGTGGFVSSVGGGVVGGAAGIASAVTRNLGNAAAALTMDDKYGTKRLLAQQQRAEHAGQGLRMGFTALGEGFAAGAKGLVSKPITGAMDEGVKGFVKGIGRGLVGAIAKPSAGVASLLSKTTEGIASDAKRVAHGFRKTMVGLRVRQPRVIEEGILKSYPKVVSRASPGHSLGRRPAPIEALDCDSCSTTQCITVMRDVES